MIHILDKQTDTILAFLNKELTAADHDENLNHEETFDFTVRVGEKSQFIKDRNRVIIPVEDGSFREFIIINTQTNSSSVYAKGNASYLDLDKQRVIEPGIIDGQTLESISNRFLTGTEWQLGEADFSGSRKVTIENHIGVFQALKQICTLFDVEMRFRVEVKGNRVAGRFVDFYKKRGQFRGKEVVFGKDLIEIRRIEDGQNTVTALFCIGPEKEDGGRITTIVKDEEALQRWGRNGRHLWSVYEPESTDTEMSLSRLTQLGNMELKKRINSLVKYETTQAVLDTVKGLEHEKVFIADTIRIKDEHFTPPLYAEARVHHVRRSLLDKSKKDYVLGDFIQYSKDEVRKRFKELQKIYGVKVIKSPTQPTGRYETIWIDTSGEFEVIKTWNGVSWVPATPTRAEEIGAIDVEDAQDMVDRGKQEAIDESTIIADEKDRVIQRVIEDKLAEETERLLADATTKVNNLRDAVAVDIGNLNTKADNLVSLVDTLDADLKANNGTVTSLKQSVDELTGEVKSISGQVTNIDGTLSQTVTKVSQLATGLEAKAEKTVVDTLTGNVSSLSTEVYLLAGQLTSSISRVEGKIDGLKGGRNLILNSSFKNSQKWGGITRFIDGPQGMRAAEISRSGYEGTQRSTLYQTTALRGKTLVEEGKTYTLSGWFYIDSSMPLDSDSSSILVRKYKTGSTQVNDFINVIIRLSEYQYDKWYYFEKTGTVPAGYVGNDQVALALGKNGKIAVSMLMLEEGSKAGSWIPAIEDTDQEVSELRSYASTIDQKADSISSRVSATETTINKQTGEIETAKQNITTLQQTANGLDLKVSSLETDLSNISGGYNLIQNSQFRGGFQGWVVSPSLNQWFYDEQKKLLDENTVRYVQTSGSYYPMLRSVMIPVENTEIIGKKVTLSVYIFVPSGVTFSAQNQPYIQICGYTDPNSSTDIAIQTYNVPNTIERNKWVRISVTGTIPSSIGTAVPNVKYIAALLRFNAAGMNTPAGMNFWYGLPQMEIGSKATNWTPSPKDLSNRVQIAETQLTVQAGEIESKVSSIDYTGNKITSMINQTATTIKIEAERIDLVGKITASMLNVTNLSAITSTLGKVYLVGDQNWLEALDINDPYGSNWTTKVSIIAGIISAKSKSASESVGNSDDSMLSGESGLHTMTAYNRLNSLRKTQGIPYGSLPYEYRYRTSYTQYREGIIEAGYITAPNYLMPEWGGTTPTTSYGRRLYMLTDSFAIGNQNRVLMDVRPARQSGTYANETMLSFPNGVYFRTLSASGNFFRFDSRIDTESNVIKMHATGNNYFSGNGQVALKSDKINSGEGLWVGEDGKPKIWSMDIYNRGYSSAANVHITQYGTIGFTTSARRHKLLIEDISEEQINKILNVHPRTWFDKTASEKYAELLEREANGEVINWDEEDCGEMVRIPGVIAEEVEEAGLPELVQYKKNPDGTRSVETVMYDRLPVYLVPIAKRHDNKINIHEGRLDNHEDRLLNVESRLEQLEAKQ
ncbi:phage tail spike protein [Cytobacillus horneckiae]|uniref:phage tail spike protein n=1 Tax=Cytobacillus horneckiae TaxID=549687 RepID=UPI003D9A3D87